MENIKESTFTVRKLTASENFYLTQAELQEGEERVFTKVAFLAKDQPAEYWREATEEERQEYIRTHENNLQ